jgi:hypothetical protein
MYTRKHFVDAAKRIRMAQAHMHVAGLHSEATWEGIIKAHVERFAASNPRFDEARFRAACDPYCTGGAH